ncbi:MAG: hypothetical protein KF803_10580 [Cyclobacteriaceae bacterium]|nr:hypothetical protein [Cyclobacteriaceae bacterium]
MKRNTPIQLLVLILAFFASCEEQMSDERPIEFKNEGKSSANERLVTDYRFDGKEGDAIDFAVARKWVNNYQEKNASGNKAHFFGYEILKEILSLEGCVGIRMYYALDDAGGRQIILVGVDEKGNNIVPNENGRTAEEGITADASYPCPTHCPGNGTSL